MEVKGLLPKKIIKFLLFLFMATVTLDLVGELPMATLNGKLVLEALPLILLQRDIQSLIYTQLRGVTQIPIKLQAIIILKKTSLT
jgi:hypothetical protein